MKNSLETLRYPVGRFVLPENVTPSDLEEGLDVLSGFPEALITLKKQLTVTLLDTPYRPEGWTPRQVIHHCADSHMNALVRFKMALTEDNPPIKSYDEAGWARLSDYSLPPEISIGILSGLHKRWVTLLKSLGPDDWIKTFIHPEFPQPMRLDQTLMMYSWHCRHHLAHIRSVL